MELASQLEWVKGLGNPWTFQAEAAATQMRGLARIHAGLEQVLEQFRIPAACY